MYDIPFVENEVIFSLLDTLKDIYSAAFRVARSEAIKRNLLPFKVFEEEVVLERDKTFAERERIQGLRRN